MVSRVLAVAFIGVSVFVGCSGAIPNDGDGGVTRGDGGCFYPVQGAKCSTGDVSCVQGNPCCDGKWDCTNGRWNLLMFGCACLPADAGWDAGPFVCGGATCTASQMCVDQAPGIAFPDGGTPPHSYSCSGIPSACAPNPTCACVKANGACAPTGLASCDENAGHITVHCLGQ